MLCENDRTHFGNVHPSNFFPGWNEDTANISHDRAPGNPLKLPPDQRNDTLPRPRGRWGCRRQHLRTPSSPGVNQRKHVLLYMPTTTPTEVSTPGRFALARALASCLKKEAPPTTALLLLQQGPLTLPFGQVSRTRNSCPTSGPLCERRSAPVILSKPGHQFLPHGISKSSTFLRGGLSPAARAGHDGTSCICFSVNWIGKKKLDASCRTQDDNTCRRKF